MVCGGEVFILASYAGEQEVGVQFPDPPTLEKCAFAVVIGAPFSVTVKTWIQVQQVQKDKDNLSLSEQYLHSSIFV